MKCPKCLGKAQVVKVMYLGAVALRYRNCTQCGHRFKSTEDADRRETAIPTGGNVAL